QPPFALPAIPDPVLGPEHPSPTLVVEHGEVSHRDPERPRLQAAGAPFLDQVLVANLSVRERIDCHGGEYAARGKVESNRPSGLACSGPKRRDRAPSTWSRAWLPSCRWSGCSASPATPAG